MNEVTWVVAADGRQADVYEERRRGGPLQRLAERALHAEDSEQPKSRQRATVHNRFGFGRHSAGDEDVVELSEARFLERVSDALERWAKAGLYDQLVVMAPPRALGHLRRALKSPAAERLVLTDNHDRVMLEVEALRRHLRTLRGQ